MMTSDVVLAQASTTFEHLRLPDLNFWVNPRYDLLIFIVFVLVSYPQADSLKKQFYSGIEYGEIQTIYQGLIARNSNVLYLYFLASPFL